MKTLVVHPADPTTDFLKPIYEGYDFTVVQENLSECELVELIRRHERIVMMGHGTSAGLFNTATYRYLIYDELVKELKKKICIGIWCHADQFFNQHQLKGFSTGMFISEVAEANLFGIDASQEMVDYSNDLFSEIVGENIEGDFYNAIKENYNSCEFNPVLEYNKARIYIY